MFTGFSAFPLTPLVDDRVDLDAYRTLVTRLVDAGVDSIGALGSTGVYAYLSRDERRIVTEAAVESADGVPVIAGVGALRTSQVQALAEDAQRAGAQAVLLAPMGYHDLSDDDVYGLYEDVAAGLSVPLVVYDNPGRTHFTFSLDLYARICRLPQVGAIKIPSAGGVEASRARVDAIRRVVPERVRVGISGDASAAAGLLGGCDAWFTAAGGTIPHAMLAIARPALDADPAALVESERLRPLWDLVATYGSIRVTAAIAEHLGLVSAPPLPRPLRGLDSADHARVARVADELNLA